MAVVIDPNLAAVDEYVRLAKAEFSEIVAVIDTHIHADHISGGRALAKASGAPLMMGGKSETMFGYESLDDGQEVPVGDAVLKVMDTPGHTVEHVSLVYTDRKRAMIPWGVFTGDSLFVGDVGRQDLDGAGSSEEMFMSLKKLIQLGDHVEVYPAHYAGSDCASNLKLSFKTTSTLGYERQVNPFLGITNVAEFQETMTRAAHSYPPDFHEIKRVNRGLS